MISSNSIPLHRASIDSSVSLGTYRSELAQTAARWTDNADGAAALELEKEIVEISSLQSEGYQKRQVADADVSKLSLKQINGLAEELAADKSFIYAFNPAKKPDAETVEVLGDVAEHVARLTSNTPENFILAPVGYPGGTDQLEVRVGEKNGAEIGDMFSVFFHQTPGLDNGLMVVRPYEGDVGAKQELLNRLTLNLGHPEHGWHFAGERTPSAAN